MLSRAHGSISRKELTYLHKKTQNSHTAPCILYLHELPYPFLNTINDFIFLKESLIKRLRGMKSEVRRKRDLSRL